MSIRDRPVGPSRSGAALIPADLPVAFWGTVLARFGEDRDIASAGWADWSARVGNDAETRFNTASITKLFTAIAVCRLVEAGDLRLEQAVATVLPDSGIEAASEIRIEQLLAHRGGFPEETVNDGTDSDSWLAAARVPLQFRPGTAWAYSNVGYALLGAVIEHVTGRSYYEIVDALVFSPAGMAATAFDDPAAAEPPHALGYAFEDDRALEPIADNRGELGRGTPYGYAYSTVGDLERLIDALAAGRLVNSTRKDLILEGDVVTGQPGRWAGFGMFRESVGTTRVATLSGAGPGISAWLDYSADRQYLTVTLSNRPKPAAHSMGLALRRNVMPERKGGSGEGGRRDPVEDLHPGM